MGIDLVHDTQETYRKLLYSMSRPGQISTLSKEEEMWVPCHHATFLTALTLLDAEVSFHVVSDKNNLGKVLSDYTFSNLTPIEQADYIIVPNGTTETEILGAMKKSKIGNLLDPQTSATWMIEQNEIRDNGKFTMTGPGIKHESKIHLDVSEVFWEMRKEKVNEFPLGIELIFTDSQSNLVCIPRTTNIFIDGGVM